MAKSKALSNSDRQRKHRSKIIACPEEHERYLRAERVRWQQRKAENKIKTVADMSGRELRAKRKQWKEAKQANRQQKNVTGHLHEVEDNLSAAVSTSSLGEYSTPRTSRQFTQSRKKVGRNRSKMHRENYCRSR